MSDPYIDTISDFDRAADDLPEDVRRPLDDRQHDVVAARERAQANDGLLRMHIRGARRGRLRRRPRVARLAATLRRSLIR